MTQIIKFLVKNLEKKVYLKGKRSEEKEMKLQTIDFNSTNLVRNLCCSKFLFARLSDRGVSNLSIASERS